MSSVRKLARRWRRWHASDMHAPAMRAPLYPPVAMPAVPAVPLRPLALLLLVGLALPTAGCPQRQPEKLTTLPVVTTDDPEAEAHMRAARQAEDEGRIDDARASYRSFLEEHPDDDLAAVARLGLGRVLLAEGEVEPAREHFEAVMDHPDPAVAERAKFYLGVTLHLAGQHAEALETLAPYVGKTVDPEDTALLLRTLAAAAIHVGDRVRAVEAYDRLMDSTAPEEAKTEAEQRIATLVEETASPKDIRALYERLPHDGTAWPQVAVRAAKQAYDDGDTAGAQEILAALESEDVPFDEELQEIAVRVERTGEADPRVIGAILPLSGRGREVGQQALRGLMLASGTPHEGPIPSNAAQVVFRDDAGNPERAAKAVEDLVTLHQAIAIIGPIDGEAASRAAERARELGVPLVTLTPSTGVTETGDRVFRLFFTPEGEVRALVRAARARGAERFAALHPDNAFGKAFARAYERQVETQGGQLVARVSYEAGSTSFGRVIRKLRSQRFDALLVPDSAPTVQLVAPALAAAGLWSRPEGERAPERGRAITLLVPSVGHSREVLKESSRYLQGALFSLPFNPHASTGRGFAERFHTRFGSNPDVFAAYAHDAFAIVRHAVKGGAETREALTERLRSGKTRRTVGASGGLGEDREPARATRIYEVRGTELGRLR